VRGTMLGVYLTAPSYEELRSIFDALASGAGERLLDDLRDMPFGIYGHLADRFGVHW
jgi:uncharacterized glyoxalase superfamily protein PhnB